MQPHSRRLTSLALSLLAVQFLLAPICVVAGESAKQSNGEASHPAGAAMPPTSPDLGNKALIAEGQKLDGQSASFYFQGKYREAIEPMVKSTELYVRSLGPNHYYVGDNYTHLGNMYFKLKEYGPAEKYYKLALEIFEKTGSCQMGDAITNYATILRSTNRALEAERVEAKYKAHCPSSH